jgi:hypothetical protein
MVLSPFTAWAGPPSGAHPRLFMGTADLTRYAANATTKGTAAAAMVASCQDTIDKPQLSTTRGGADGDAWPGAAVACAFAYAATQKAAYLTQAIKYWKASLNDDQTIGDGLGCVPGVNSNWQSWNGSQPAPPVLITITHDTGYPIRWYGPFVALTYDWLYSAPGVDEPLRAQTRLCLGAWIDWYSKSGYLRDVAGANYNAGFAVGKTMAAIAIGTDGGADGHLWTETLSLFSDLLIGKGLAGSAGEVGTPAGVLVGGDWQEGWEYGPLSVLEYAAAARAIEENGTPLPEMDTWANSLIVRYVQGTVPHNDAQFTGNGDFDSEQVYPAPNVNELDAVLLGPTSDQAAAWAKSMKDQQKLTNLGYVWNALAETRSVAAQDYKAQTPRPPLWYLARGTRTMYMRSSWDQDAFWAVFASQPQLVADHLHFAASNFVFTRGGDHLIVDPSDYGEVSTIATNAVSVDSAVTKGDYRGSQTPWSQADLPWARGADSGVVAGRADFAKAFIYSSTPSDIPYAHREWVFLPEGEAVTIDRVRTDSPDRKTYVQFHVNTAGTLKRDGAVTSGVVGSSRLVIHTVALSGGTPAISQPTVGDCKLSCSYPCGQCDAARFAVDEYAVQIPGPNALAIHVFDGLGASDQPAVVGSLNDDTYDPAPKKNSGVIGAAINRGSKQSYVVASSATDGIAGDVLSYSVAGDAPSRHIVFDAPEDTAGKSNVTTAVDGKRCTLSLSKGPGLAGHPVMFQVSSAADGCKVAEDTNLAPGSSPVGGGVTPLDGGSSTTPPPAVADGGSGITPPPAVADAASGTTPPTAVADAASSTCPVAESGDGSSSTSTDQDGGSGSCPAPPSPEKSGCGCNLTGKSTAGINVELLVLAFAFLRPIAGFARALRRRPNSREAAAPCKK